MKPSSSTSDGLLAPLFADPDVEAAISDAALVAAMLDVERELARAQAGLGLIPAEGAEAIAATCDSLRPDVAGLGRAGMSAGNPVSPLVRALTEAVPDDARPYVHLGTTSQDVLDTALMLLARRAGARITALLDRAADALATVTETHRATVLAARTLGQQALPTTFGRKAAGWLVAVDDATARLGSVLEQRLAVQLGGAAGTLAGFDAAGPELVAALAGRLGLAEPVLPWHTDRQRLLELAAALAAAIATAGKVALDLVLLAQTEVGEVVPGAGGGSTAMPHKQNPVGAILIRSAAVRAPGLLATLFSAASLQEHERAAGAWHAEWEPLRDLLSLAGGSAGRLAAVVPDLVVSPERMASNLERTGDLVLSESVAARLAPRLGREAAHDLVRRCAARAAETGQPFRDVLAAEPQVEAELGDDGLTSALDPQNWSGASQALIDRALAAHAQRIHREPT
jgi:3-carboxy-cis,cis-muconate cycloisomerase